MPLRAIPEPASVVPGPSLAILFHASAILEPSFVNNGPSRAIPEPASVVPGPSLAILSHVSAILELSFVNIGPSLFIPAMSFANILM